MNLEQKIIKTIKNYGMLKKGERVLLAVSGGPDSVFLTHILCKLEDKLGITLRLAHLDHGIRGKESAKDCRFVKNLAESLKIPFVTEKLRMKKRNQKISLEEVLREKRYAFLKKEAKRFRQSVIATAHTLDDQAETVLMRIIKGTSLKGIVGIHPVRYDKSVRFIRPLIEIEKCEILSWLKKKALPYCIDSTNLDDSFLRNRVRNKIIPYLERVNPRLKRSLFNLSQSIEEDYRFIEDEKRKRLNLLNKRKKVIYLELKDLIMQPKALQREIIRELLIQIGGNIKKLTFRHWKEIDLFLREKAKNKKLSLPGGVELVKEKARLSALRALKRLKDIDI